MLVRCGHLCDRVIRVLRNRPVAHHTEEIAEYRGEVRDACGARVDEVEPDRLLSRRAPIGSVAKELPRRAARCELVVRVVRRSSLDGLEVLDEPAEVIDLV